MVHRAYSAGLSFMMLAAAVCCTPVCMGAEVERGEFFGVCRQDQPFPEFMPLWREGWKQFDAEGRRIRHARPDMPLGAYLEILVRNPGESPFDIRDVSLEGVSLQQAIAPEGEGRGRHDLFASSLQFSKLPREQIETLERLGEPVWWKADPFTVPARGWSQVIVRLRRAPRAERIRVRVEGEGVAISGEIDPRRAEPRIVGIGFTPEMTTAFVYVQPGRPGAVPKRILIDGRDRSDHARFSSDPRQPVLPVTVKLDKPMAEGEFHALDVECDDGSRAAFGLRVHRADFVYGMWGGFAADKDAAGAGPGYLQDLHRHTINTIMSQYGQGVRQFIRSDTGQKLSAELGIRITDNAPGGYPNQRYTFLHDEPDAKDVNSRSIEPIGRRLGSRGRWLVEMGRDYRRQAPDMLQFLNIDNTFKPEQWYMYAQLPDVPCADPYYQEQLRSVYHTSPGTLGAYTKPTYVYAAGRIYQSAGAPRPMHLILHTCRFDMPENPFRPPTPEEKRVEIYYCLGAGARGISFWWYTPSSRYHGLGSDAPVMRRLFAEIGLAGTEIGVAEPLLARSTPTELAIEPSDDLWARALLAGEDAVVLLVVNDNIASDRTGTVVLPHERARVRLRPPVWLKARDAFEITPAGVADVSWKAAGEQVECDLGPLRLTRMVVLTSDPQLRANLQQRYETRYAERARSLQQESEQLARSRPGNRG